MWRHKKKKVQTERPIVHGEFTGVYVSHDTNEKMLLFMVSWKVVVEERKKNKTKKETDDDTRKWERICGWRLGRGFTAEATTPESLASASRHYDNPDMKSICAHTWPRLRHTQCAPWRHSQNCIGIKKAPQTLINVLRQSLVLF